MTDQYHVVTAHEPATVVNNMEYISAKIDLSCITKPPEEDKRKLTFVLGDIKINTDDGPVNVPDEMLEKMSENEAKAIKGAFETEIKRKPGNKIIVTCKTRKDALLLEKWKGIQEKRYILPKPPAGMLHEPHVEQKLTKNHPKIGGRKGKEGKEGRKNVRRSSINRK